MGANYQEEVPNNFIGQAWEPGVVQNLQKNMTDYSIDSSHCHLWFDESIPPALSMDSGQTVSFKTLDACWGEVRSIDDFHQYRRNNPHGGSNPITGPVYIHQAVPGGTLIVDVDQIDLDSTGFQLIGPHRAMIQNEIADWTLHQVHAHDGRVRLGNGLELPADPVIGQLGTAPAGPRISHANPCGGNLDCPLVRTGAKVYFPIEVPGALFSVGDVHARQGDGEIVGAPEIGATVTLRLTCVKQRLANWPVVEDSDGWHVIATAPTESEAIRLAVFELSHLIQAKENRSMADAMILLTMTARIRCARSGKWGDQGPVVSVSIAKQFVPELLPWR